MEGAARRKRKEKKRGEGKKGKKERKRKERKKLVRKKRERERSRKGKRCFDGRNSSDQEVKSVYTMRVGLQEVRILHTLVYFYPLSYFFGLLLGPHCAMFMVCFVVLIGI